jgi:hypothetical protein
VGSGYSLHISLSSEHYLNACEKVRLSLAMLPSISSFAMWKSEGWPGRAASRLATKLYTYNCNNAVSLASRDLAASNPRLKTFPIENL